MTKHDEFLAKAGAAANVILVGGAAASALVFAHFFYRYGWTGDRHFSTWLTMVVHYGGPAGLAALLIGALTLRREYRINVAIACVTTLLSLYGGEFVLHVIDTPFRTSGLPVMEDIRRSPDKQALAAKLAQRSGVPIDARSGVEAVADLRAKGIEAVRTVLPGLQLLVPEHPHSGTGIGKPAALPPFVLGGISNMLTLLCNESGQFVTYQSDQHGFRNAPRSWQSPLDIAAVGDSFTQGYCAPDGQYFVDLIRQEYPGTLNLGMSGDGPLLELATVKEYLPRLRPKLVLWFYFEGNDLLDLREERRSALLRRYLDDGFNQELWHRQTEVDQVFLDFMRKEEAWEEKLHAARLRKRQDVVGHLLAFAALPRLRVRLGLLTGRTPKELDLATELNDLALFRQVLSTASATVASWGGTLDFVYLPDAPRFMPHYAFDRRLAERHHAQILKVVSQLGIPVIDVLGAFEAHPDPASLFPFRGPGHYAESGHQVVAGEVLKAIDRSGVLRNRGVIAEASALSRSATPRRHATPSLPSAVIDRKRGPLAG
jgi:hypothetical protein